MVIKYPTIAEGSCFGFFFTAPRILFRLHGSVVPFCFIQVCMCVGIGVIASYWNPIRENLPSDATPSDAYSAIGFLLSFLLVFKTQSAYNQYWTAISHAEQLMVVYRELGIGACTVFKWDKDGKECPARQYARKLMRLIVLHFHVLLEFFRRTGVNQTKSDKQKDTLRGNIHRLAGPDEFRALYPDEAQPKTGSASEHPHTQPTIVVLWIDLVISRCVEEGYCLSLPHAASMSSLTASLMQHFQVMNQIDKTQFPFPYAQLVKILVCGWTFTLPFVLEMTCGAFTPFAMGIIATAVFGLDEVAEILESPFGLDPNDIDLERFEKTLVNELELLYYGRANAQLLLADDKDLCLRGIDDEGGAVDKSVTRKTNTKKRWTRFTSQKDIDVTSEAAFKRTRQASALMHAVSDPALQKGQPSSSSLHKGQPGHDPPLPIQVGRAAKETE